MRTTTVRVISYVKRYCGRSATEIANALKEDPATISGILHRL